MPLPSDEKLIALANEILAAFEKAFGPHAGFRPAHAKGILLQGTFTPSPDAVSLTRAPHVLLTSTPVTARFSDATGLPMIADNDSNAGPRGLAIRFQLAEHVHTDIIGHSVDGFPVRTGQEFLEFLLAAGTSRPGTPSPTPIEKFFGARPAALAFARAAQLAPSSFAREAYFGVTALRFINKDGGIRYGRFRITPEAGIEHLDQAAAKDADYLFDELTHRLTSGPVGFRIQVQIAGEGDVVDDATIHWPEDRPLIPFGTVVLAALAPDNEAQQKQIIFDPIPRVDGMEPSDDPLLELRAAIYLLSGRRRRQAPELKSRLSTAV